jgi:hypothetical protein
MINPKGKIYEAFVTALSGITYQSNPVPVYTFPAPGNIPFYIQLGSITTVEEGCVDLFGHECTIDIQIISQYDGNYGTPLDSEAISDIVTQTLKATETSTVDIQEFDMVYIVLDNGFNDSGLNPSNRGYRTINQYRFLILEVPDPTIWILADGTWNDSGVWVDSAVWID